MFDWCYGQWSDSAKHHCRMAKCLQAAPTCPYTPNTRTSKSKKRSRPFMIHQYDISTHAKSAFVPDLKAQMTVGPPFQRVEIFGPISWVELSWVEIFYFHALDFATTLVAGYITSTVQRQMRTEKCRQPLRVHIYRYSCACIAMHKHGDKQTTVKKHCENSSNFQVTNSS